MVFLFGEGVLKTLKKKKRTDRRKTLKNEQKGKRRIQGKSNKNNICYYLLYKKIYFAQKNTLKKKNSLYHAGYLEHSNDTPDLIFICNSV